MKKNGFILIGKIVGAHSLKGAFKVRSYVESLSVYKPGRLIRVSNTKGQAVTYTIKWAKPHTGNILLFFEEINSRTTAETLIGSELFIDKSILPELNDGSYYWSDIIGLSVYSVDESYMGLVESIIPTGSNDVYVVKNGDKEILVPGIESVVLEINLKQKMMRVDLPEGL
ncbi:MAG: ribosome maturation factor RimM [Thermodesulfobacteriota bacterium]|nr:ribosome maturation factor RimM [Thermodesulfobacteriota bacterium]